MDISSTSATATDEIWAGLLGGLVGWDDSLGQELNGTSVRPTASDAVEQLREVVERVDVAQNAIERESQQRSPVPHRGADCKYPLHGTV